MSEDGDDAAASRRTPGIPGLYAFPELLDSKTSDTIVAALASDNLFNGGHRDQVMLFSRAPRRSSDPSAPSSSNTSDTPTDIPYIPPYLTNLLSTLSDLLRPLVPPPVHSLIFSQPLARQIILNLYPAGQGITPHIDLPNRYADGILGVSLLGSCAMIFESEIGEVETLFMPRGTVYVLSGEARWEWTHGIVGKELDEVWDEGAEDTEGRTRKKRSVLRGTRLSVTFRYMQEGADVLS